MKGSKSITHEHVSQKDTEIISLMIQFLENKLSETCSVQISEMVSTCKECQKLFEEVQFFFNEKETFMYEMLNAEEIEKHRKSLRSFINTNPIQEVGSQKYSSSFDEEYYDIIKGPCSCC